MNKMKIIGILSKLIFVLAFNVIFFLIAGFDHPASVWIAYAMIHLSYFMLVFTPWFIKGGKTAVETGSPLAMLSGINFLLNFVIGLIFMLVAPDGITFEIVLYVILFSIYFALFFTICLANTHTEEAVARRGQETFFIKNQASKLKMLIGKTDDSDLNKLLETLSDNIHASPSRSGGVAATVESGIVMKICEIESSVFENRVDDAKKLCRELFFLIEERKRVLSINY